MELPSHPAPPAKASPKPWLFFASLWPCLDVFLLKKRYMELGEITAFPEDQRYWSRAPSSQTAKSPCSGSALTAEAAQAEAVADKPSKGHAQHEGSALQLPGIVQSPDLRTQEVTWKQQHLGGLTKVTAEEKGDSNNCPSFYRWAETSSHLHFPWRGHHRDPGLWAFIAWTEPRGTAPAPLDFLSLSSSIDFLWVFPFD